MIVECISGKADRATIGGALLLRLQSGRSHRHVNIPGNLKFGDTGTLSGHDAAQEPVPFINALCTKPLGAMTVQGVANAQGRVQLLLTDKVTQFLWDAWAGEQWTADIPREHAYVFPKQGRDGFEWNLPMTRLQHDRVVQRCAQVMGLAFTADELKSITSKAVRCGVSAKVARQLRETLTGGSKTLGRAAGSNMDIGVYTPKEVLMEPGPLHSDEADVSARLEQALAEHFGPLKNDLLCKHCGFPGCVCMACGPAKRGSHTCWLKGRMGPKPRKAGYSETDDQCNARLAAWLGFGIDEVPVWDGTGYAWPPTA